MKKKIVIYYYLELKVKILKEKRKQIKILRSRNENKLFYVKNMHTGIENKFLTDTLQLVHNSGACHSEDIAFRKLELTMKKDNLGTEK